ncbi:Membrane protein [hydrothermal vent metagenome]|uniref:Membrane protein n=1 Tax=hydrothermal vent metagenome TaxID=652676 RepID=A0A1W1BXM6_9ZZZZ
MLLLRFILLCLIFIEVANAHQSGLSYINIEKKPSDLLAVTYKKPLSDTRGQDITINYPKRCMQITPTQKVIENGFIIRTYTLDCGQKGLHNSRIWIHGLVSSDRGVLIRYDDKEHIYKSLLRSTSPFIAINQKLSNIALFFEYLQMGIMHILTGFDHLSFVMGLLILAPSLRALLFTISAFTLSHSITLALGILGTVTINTAFVEAMIALSILFLAKEITSPHVTLTKKHLGFVAFLFGFVHGMGFSSSLADIGLPHDEIPLSLFAFNLGIEIGQITFIIIASAILYFLYKFFKKSTVHLAIAYIIGSVASFWIYERVLF